MSAERNEALRVAVLERARADGDWFTHLSTRRLKAELLDRQERDRCELHRLRLYDGRSEAQVVVKVRRAVTPAAKMDRAARPTVVTADPLSKEELAQREFDGLTIAAGAMADEPGRFMLVRPLALLTEFSAVVMDHVETPRLRSAVMAASRIAPLRSTVNLDSAFFNAGAWLGRYHHVARPSWTTTTRTDQRDQVGSLVRELCGFLAARTEDNRFFERLARAGAERVEHLLPTRLPVAVGHGDFVLRNLFSDSAGRVSVIDPMPRWLVPPHEDLTRFLVGLKLIGLQVTTHGLAFPRNRLLHWQQHFLAGYGDANVPARGELETYELLVLLDKWSAMVARASRAGPRGWLAAVHCRHAHRYFRWEAALLIGRAGHRASGGGGEARWSV
jgi:hypothetical protein